MPESEFQVIDAIARPVAVEPLKQRDLRKCAWCRRGVMHGNSIVFYRISISRYVVNLPAVQRQHGLEQFMGQAAVLAQVMGPDEDMAKPLGDGFDVLVCDECSMRRCIAAISEAVNELREGEA